MITIIGKISEFEFEVMKSRGLNVEILDVVLDKFFDSKDKKEKVRKLTEALEEAREQRYETIFREFDLFGGNDCWEYIDDEDGWEINEPDEYTKIFYVNAEDSEESERWIFKIKFMPNSTNVIEAYVLDNGGNEISYRNWD